VKRSAYVQLCLAQPGDVLLSAGRKWPVSETCPLWAVRVCTLSWFTHASIFMTRLGRLETNGPGLCSQLTVGSTALDANGRLLLATGCARAVLMRPTEAALERWATDNGKSAKTFGHYVAHALLAYLGREYAEADLSGAALWPFRLFASAIVRRSARGGNSSFMRRWSCSSLVAQAYEDAGLRLTKKAATTVSPGTIRRTPVLRPVRGAIVRLKPTEFRNLSDAQPAYVIGGALSIANMKKLLERTLLDAVMVGRDVAAGQLEAEIEALIGVPSPELTKLFRRERELLRDKKLCA
jgi:hypothetical protein